MKERATIIGLLRWVRHPVSEFFIMKEKNGGGGWPGGRGRWACSAVLQELFSVAGGEGAFAPALQDRWVRAVVDAEPLLGAQR